MGKNGLSITYDTVFRHVMLPGGDTKRLEHFLSIIFDQPIHIKQLLPREGSQIVENGSFVIADIIASLHFTWHFPLSRSKYRYGTESMAEFSYRRWSGWNRPSRQCLSGISSMLSGYYLDVYKRQHITNIYLFNFSITHRSSHDSSIWQVFLLFLCIQLKKSHICNIIRLSLIHI